MTRPLEFHGAIWNRDITSLYKMRTRVLTYRNTDDKTKKELVEALDVVIRKFTEWSTPKT